MKKLERGARSVGKASDRAAHTVASFDLEERLTRALVGVGEALDELT